MTSFIICLNVLTLRDSAKKCIPVKYLKNPKVLKFHELMNTEDMSLLTKVVTFCKSIVSFFDRTNK